MSLIELIVDSIWAKKLQVISGQSKQQFIQFLNIIFSVLFMAKCSQ